MASKLTGPGGARGAVEAGAGKSPARPGGAAGEQRLVARATRGDVEAFGALVREHSGLVYGIARRMLGREDAGDASQEVWVRVWTGMKNFRGESAFGTWLHRIAVNTCLSLRRKEARRKEREVGDETPSIPAVCGRDGDPEAAALGAERRGELQIALCDVREEHRAAMVLRHMEGLSYAEIAQVLGVPNGTAKGWASRGRAEMRLALDRGRRPGVPGKVGEGAPLGTAVRAEA